jgi:hypothetical protein
MCVEFSCRCWEPLKKFDSDRLTVRQRMKKTGVMRSGDWTKNFHCAATNQAAFLSFPKDLNTDVLNRKKETFVRHSGGENVVSSSMRV